MFWYSLFIPQFSDSLCTYVFAKFSRIQMFCFCDNKNKLKKKQYYSNEITTLYKQKIFEQPQRLRPVFWAMSKKKCKRNRINLLSVRAHSYSHRLPALGKLVLNHGFSWIIITPRVLSGFPKKISQFFGPAV